MNAETGRRCQHISVRGVLGPATGTCAQCDAEVANEATIASLQSQLETAQEALRVATDGRTKWFLQACGIQLRLNKTEEALRVTRECLEKNRHAHELALHAVKRWRERYGSDGFEGYGVQWDAEQALRATDAEPPRLEE